MGHGSRHRDSGNSDYKTVTSSLSRLMPVTENFLMIFSELLPLSHFLISQLHSCSNAQQTKMCSCPAWSTVLASKVLLWSGLWSACLTSSILYPPLPCGLPQGSIPGPIHYPLYICTSGSIVRKKATPSTVRQMTHSSTSP